MHCVVCVSDITKDNLIFLFGLNANTTLLDNSTFKKEFKCVGKRQGAVQVRKTIDFFCVRKRSFDDTFHRRKTMALSEKNRTQDRERLRLFTRLDLLNKLTDRKLC